MGQVSALRTLTKSHKRLSAHTRTEHRAPAQPVYRDDNGRPAWRAKQATSEADFEAGRRPTKARAAGETRQAKENAAKRAEQEERTEERFRAFEREANRRRQHCTPPPNRAAHAAPVWVWANALMGDEVEQMTTDTLALHAVRYQGCPHRVLGLAPYAKAEAVRKRFLTLARRLHPDKTDHPSAAEAFASLEGAFRAMQPPRTERARDCE